MLKIERKRRNWISPLVWLWLVFIILAVLTGLFVAKDITFMGDTLKSQLPAEFVVDSKWGGWIALGSLSLFPWLFFISYSSIKEKSLKKNTKEGKGLETTLGIIFAILLLAGIAVSGLNFGDSISYSLDTLKTSTIFLGVSAVPALVIVLIIGIITYLIVARVFYKKDLFIWAEARLKELEEEETQRIANESKAIEEEKKAEPVAQETPATEEAAPTAQENDFDRRIINALNPTEDSKEVVEEKTEEAQPEVQEERASDKTPDYWYNKNEVEAQPVETASTKEPVEETKTEEAPAEETKVEEPKTATEEVKVEEKTEEVNEETKTEETATEEQASDKTPDYWYGKNETEAQPVEAEVVEEEAKPETVVANETVEVKTEEVSEQVKTEETPAEEVKPEETITEPELIPASEILADGLYLRDSAGKVITFAQPTNNNNHYYAFAKIHQGRLDLFKVTDGVEKRIPEPVENHGYTLLGTAREIIQIQNGLSNINYSDKSIYSFINKNTKLIFNGDENHEYEIDITIYDNASSGEKNNRWIAISVK